VVVVCWRLEGCGGGWARKSRRKSRAFIAGLGGGGWSVWCGFVRFK
jgi:hypothetical protein